MSIPSRRAYPSESEEGRSVRSGVNRQGDVEVVVDGYTVQFSYTAEGTAVILAPGVPPSVVAKLLAEQRIGHLEDYDRAALRVDWRVGLLSPDQRSRAQVGLFHSAQVVY